MPSHATPTPIPLASRRLGALDLGRFIAALAIVGFHTQPYVLGQTPGTIGVLYELAFKWAVPFFFATSGYLHGLSRHAEDPAWLRKRLLRLAIPYAVWTTLRLIDLDPITPLTLAKQYLLCSPTSTLWFLWTLMLCIALAWGALRLGMEARTLAMVSMALAVVQAAAAQFWWALGDFGQLMYANPWYAYQSPLLWLWVYAAGLWLARSGWAAMEHAARERITWTLFITVALSVALRYFGASAESLFLGYHFAWGLPGLWAGSYGVTALLIVLLARAENPPAWWGQASELSLGIYLVHPALLRVVGMVPLLAWLRGIPLVLWVVVAAVSVSIVAVLVRVPVLRRLVV